MPDILHSHVNVTWLLHAVFIVNHLVPVYLIEFSSVSRFRSRSTKCVVIRTYQLYLHCQLSFLHLRLVRLQQHLRTEEFCLQKHMSLASRLCFNIRNPGNNNNYLLKNHQCPSVILLYFLARVTVLNIHLTNSFSRISTKLNVILKMVR